MERAMSDKLVLTPGGFRPSSFVKSVEPDHGITVLDTGVFAKLNLATNTVTEIVSPPAALHAQFAAHGPGGAPAAALAPPPAAFPNGWQTYAWWDSADQSITYFSTEWSVPSAPSTSSGQTIFLFNGIQNTGTGYGILQPVLQWGSSGAGGGAYWTVASWYVASSGQAFHTNLIRVDPGTKLQGVMTQTSVAGALYNYSCTFQGIANTTLPVTNIAPLHWANETLECYGLTKCSDMPAAAGTAMDAIEIRLGAAHPTLQWTPVDAVTNCGQHTVVARNANPNGEVVLYYK
jgi:hypothetical protein